MTKSFCLKSISTFLPKRFVIKKTTISLNNTQLHQNSSLFNDSRFYYLNLKTFKLEKNISQQKEKSVDGKISQHMLMFSE